MTRLSVNVNKVATLRNTRTIGIPSVTRIARICLDAGAAGITVHPRPDGRHIRRGDVLDIAELLREYPDAELNIEGNPFHGLVDIVREARPTQCTLVPDAVDVPTSNEGWNVAAEVDRLRDIVAELHSHGCRVSLFVDADARQITRVPETGAERIELYTEPYAAGFARGEGATALAPFVDAARAAAAAGLGINAGHDLNLDNLPLFVASIPDLLEVSIGHALIADALEFGMNDTVRRYLAAITR